MKGAKTVQLVKPITTTSLFVVSGGARGITARCVIALAERHQCNFILLGRSARSIPETSWTDPDADERALMKQVSTHLLQQGEKPAPARVKQIVRGIIAEREIGATLEAIERAGGRAEYLSVDVTDAAAVERLLPPAIAQFGASVTGLIHGAGNLADKLIEKKTIADFEQVYNVKVRGLQHLLATISPTMLNYLVLFGSVAGFYGNIGQADYAIANEIFNKTAQLVRQTYPNCRVVTINWGPWDGGMVTPELRRYFDEHQIRLIPIEDGTQMFIYELENLQHTDTSAQVVVGDAIRAVPAQVSEELRSYQIERNLVLAANSFLHDHTIGEHPVLPAVFGVAWMTNTCEELYPGYAMFNAQNFKVLKGIVFDEHFTGRYILDLNERRKNADEIVLDGLIWSATADGKQRFNYSCQVGLRREKPAAPYREAIDLSDTDGRDGATLYENCTLFHGPAFQGIERILNLSEEKVTMLCQSPQTGIAQQGQFPLRSFNPWLADIQFQCMLVWLRRFYNAGGMPLGARLVEQYRPLPLDAPFYVSLDIESHNAGKLIGSVTAHDEAGQLYMRVQSIQVAVSARLNELFARARKVMAAHRDISLIN